MIYDTLETFEPNTPETTVPLLNGTTEIVVTLLGEPVTPQELIVKVGGVVKTINVDYKLITQYLIFNEAPTETIEVDYNLYPFGIRDPDTINI